APGARVAPQSLPVRGRHLFVTKGCLTCHTHAAVPGSGVADIAPALTARTYDAAWLARYLADPSIRAPMNPVRRMPDLDLKPAEVAALVAFINTEGARVARR
ncbi:MAG TPA: c-type cytochrome, partial [Longimicrobiales bacterium]|nr:c-type cytochrome [Longimicrobiales bacterium]